MAKTALTVQAIAQAGIIPTYQAVDAVNGNKFPNDGSTFLHIKNGSASPITATVTSVPDPYGRTGDIVINVAAGAEAVAGPYAPGLFNQGVGSADAGNAYVTFSSSTTVTAAVISLQ